MEFIDGASLSRRIAERPFSVIEALEVAEDVCAGLAAAHDAGVVHRDLKPDNVMIARDGRVVVTDFGIARAAANTSGEHTLGGMLGTPAYMAPEQVEGLEVDARADLYALGVLLFELVTGRRPFEGASPFAVAAARASMESDSLVTERPSVVAPPPVAKAHAAPKAERSVAVLPFRNAGGADDAFVAEEITDDLIDGLSMSGTLRVRPRSMIHRYADDDRDLQVIGGELGVEVVVQGSVRRQGEKLRITTRAISVADGFQLWAKRFERAVTEVLEVSDAIADAVAEALTGAARRERGGSGCFRRRGIHEQEMKPPPHDSQVEQWSSDW